MIAYNDPQAGQGFFAFMWQYGGYGGDGGHGEGMYTNYPFLMNHTYTVKLRISASGTDGTSGHVMVYAANGITTTVSNECGDPLPNITYKQLIGQYTTAPTNGWVDVPPMTIVTNANYSQLWIYPQSATNNLQFNLGVMAVDVCPSCTAGTGITFNNGQIPAGETKATVISIGSSFGTGGSGTVTVSETQTTEMLAYQEVNFLPEFHATVSTGTFRAAIIPCPVFGEGLARLIGVDSVGVELPENTDSIGENAARAKDKVRTFLNPAVDESPDLGIRVYPSVSKGIINISGNMKDLERAEFIVYDQSGRQVYKTSNSMRNNKVALNLGHLRNGVYLLQIKSATRKLTQKIIINK
jgi:hypothetical protein